MARHPVCRSQPVEHRVGIGEKAGIGRIEPASAAVPNSSAAPIASPARMPMTAMAMTWTRKIAITVPPVVLWLNVRSVVKPLVGDVVETVTWNCLGLALPVTPR